MKVVGGQSILAYIAVYLKVSGTETQNQSVIIFIQSHTVVPTLNLNSVGISNVFTV
jgi:hypothetical protein